MKSEITTEALRRGGRQFDSEIGNHKSQIKNKRVFMRTIISLVMLVALVWILLDKWAGNGSRLSLDPSPAPKSWQAIGRRVLVNKAWAMAAPSGWYMEGLPGDPNGVRFWLEGQFASSDGSVRMTVLDRTNWQNAQQGIPPLSLGTAAPGAPFRVPASTSGYFIGFVRQAQPAATGIPTSGSALLLMALRAYQQAHPAPAEVNAHIELIVESYCTPVQCDQERQQWAHH